MKTFEGHKTKQSSLLRKRGAHQYLQQHYQYYLPHCIEYAEVLMYNISRYHCQKFIFL